MPLDLPRLRNFRVSRRDEAAETAAPESPDRPAPTVRRMDFEFDQVPRHWFGGNAFATHMVNGLSVLFPDGERFFVRSVRHYLDQIDDPELQASVRAFFGQEGSHAREHQRTFDHLASQGLDPQPFLRAYKKFAFEFLEPKVSPPLRLAVTAAFEHFTATFAHQGLSGNDFDEVHPQMRELLLWHAAEEIEHKAVAFDVLREVDGRQSVRAGGMLIAMALLTGLWTWGMVSFLRQDRETNWRRSLREMIQIRRAGPIGNFQMLGMFFDYMRPGFHPDQVDDYALARDYLDSVGRLHA